MHYFTTSTQEEALTKKGILFYEGDHKDSKGNPWTVDKNRIYNIVNNTNEYISRKAIPIYTEHNKQFTNQIGAISNPLKVITITNDFVADKPQLKSLIGKSAIISEDAKIVNRDIIKKAKELEPLGQSIPISCGIDFSTDTIKEASVVGVPALEMAGLFKHNNSGISYFNTGSLVGGSIDIEELNKQKQDEDENLQEAKQLLDKLFEVFNNINATSQQELQGYSKQELYKENLTKYISMLEELLPVVKEKDLEQIRQEQEQQQQMNKKNKIISDQLQNQQQPRTNINNLRQYAQTEMPYFKPDLYEYADWLKSKNTYGEFISNPFKKEKKKKKRSILGTAAKTAAGTALGIGGLVAGRKGLNKIGGAKKLKEIGQKAYSSGKEKAKSAYNRAKSAGKAAKDDWDYNKPLGKQNFYSPELTHFVGTDSRRRRNNVDQPTPIGGDGRRRRRRSSADQPTPRRQKIVRGTSGSPSGDTFPKAGLLDTYDANQNVKRTDSKGRRTRRTRTAKQDAFKKVALDKNANNKMGQLMNVLDDLDNKTLGARTNAKNSLKNVLKGVKGNKGKVAAAALLATLGAGGGALALSKKDEDKGFTRKYTKKAKDYWNSLSNRR